MLATYIAFVITGIHLVCGCSFDVGWADWTGLGRYTHNCIELADGDSEEFAVCLLQRNSFNTWLNCGFWDVDEVLEIPVKEGSPADSLKLTGDDDLFYLSDLTDGLLQLTTKNILLTVAETPACQDCGMAQVIKICPYLDRQSFLACLCCNFVQIEQIRCLDDCLALYESDFIAPDNRAKAEYSEYSCATSCSYWEDLAILSRSHVIRKICDYVTVNGIQIGEENCYQKEIPLSDEPGPLRRDVAKTERTISFTTKPTSVSFHKPTRTRDRSANTRTPPRAWEQATGSAATQSVDNFKAVSYKHRASKPTP